MSKVTQFFRDFTDLISSSIHVAVLAEIRTFDEVKGKADIQPLQGGLTMIHQAYVFEGAYYEPGDVVLVIFLDYPADDTTERHRLEDAVVIGKVRV